MYCQYIWTSHSFRGFKCSEIYTRPRAGEPSLGWSNTNTIYKYKYKIQNLPDGFKTELFQKTSNFLFGFNTFWTFPDNFKTFFTVSGLPKYLQQFQNFPDRFTVRMFPDYLKFSSQMVLQLPGCFQIISKFSTFSLVEMLMFG